MSHVKTDKLSARTASGTITLGESGETLTVPSGVVLTNNGTASGFGKVLQVVQATKVDAFTTTSGSYVDLTGLSLSITPESTSNKVLVMMNLGFVQVQPLGFPGITIDRNGTEILVGTSGTSWNNLTSSYGPQDGSTATVGTSISSAVLDSPSSTSALTYKVQVKTSAQTLYVNRWSGALNYGSASTLIAMEIQG
jgi:hypothetical protein